MLVLFRSTCLIIWNRKLTALVRAGREAAPGLLLPLLAGRAAGVQGRDPQRAAVARVRAEQHRRRRRLQELPLRHAPALRVAVLVFFSAVTVAGICCSVPVLLT